VLFRLFLAGHAPLLGPMFLAMAAVSVATMLVGNLLALWQGHIKRLLAYSSIAHMGYILVAFLAGDPQGAAAATFYLTAYVLTLLGAFGVLSVLSGKQRDPHAIDECQGLAFSHPLLAGVFTVMLFSLAGLPLTAGFMGKFYVLAASVHRGLWGLALVLVLTSVMGLFYYLRVVAALYSRPSRMPPTGSAPLPPLSWLSVGVLCILTLMVVWIGVYPQPLIGWIRRATGMFLGPA
jgi:NADH-quinone oxidoreductase subunit N